MNAKENFINNLRELLITNNLTVKDFSKAIGISRRSVSAWFHSRSPRPQSLIITANFFDCSIDYLIGFTENKKQYRSAQKADFFTRYTYQKEKKCLTDYQIAKQCRIQTSTIAKWKEGVIPEFEILVKLCELFECGFEYLIGLSEF